MKNPCENCGIIKCTTSFHGDYIPACWRPMKPWQKRLEIIKQELRGYIKEDKAGAMLDIQECKDILKGLER